LVVKLVHSPQDPKQFTLPDDFVEWASIKMWQEYRPLQSLSWCDTVIKTYGFGNAAAADGSSFHDLGLRMPCLRLEFAELGDLWQQLQPSPGQSVPMDAKETKRVMLAVVNALTAVHELAYVHRDVKPQNVLLCKDPDSGLVMYKLCDFGLAASADNEIENDGDGTPAYMPSEKYWSQSSDTFALGRLFLACRAGRVPLPGTQWRGECPSQAVEQLRASGVYDHLQDVEWELLQVCLIQHGSDRPWPASLNFHTNYFLAL
jgi:serine/threonine protein kinase